MQGRAAIQSPLRVRTIYKKGCTLWHWRATVEAERWRNIERLYQAARALQPSDREAFLEGASHSTEVRREVVSLLEQSESGSSPLDRPAWGGADPSEDLPQATSCALTLGTLLGPYKIENALGAGGMGVVYSA